ncbi:hypothetical protein NQZ68_033950 [Dissostichus eleginoides]|nr:hypothetical protein NQZ68_033950 [Dissostichus eleginoides]
MKRKPRVVYSARVTPAIRAKCVLGSVSENKLEPTVEIPKEGGGGEMKPVMPWTCARTNSAGSLTQTPNTVRLKMPHPSVKERFTQVSLLTAVDFALKQKSHQQLSGVSASPNRVFCEVSGLTA